MANKELLDVIIIGGGPAGLSAALVLGRARKRVVVIDEGKPRNAVTQEAHGFLTRDGIRPSELRRLAMEDISRYPSVSFVRHAVTGITGADGHFQASTSEGEVLAAKKLLFAVGMKDRPLDIPGLAEVYGKSAFVCPYCDGWELRDEPLVIINSGPELMHFAPIISGWSNRLTFCTHGPDGLTDEQREELGRHQIPLHTSPIRAIDSRDGIVQQVLLEDGTVIPCRGIFFKPDLVPGSDLPQQLGCEISDTGVVAVDMLGMVGATNVPGIYSAGDIASRMHQAIAAASMGSLTAASINSQLNLEAWQSQGTSQ
ncbi:NAD(P)/FAD-dependent oxidoreductase [Paenibacillus senegalimassiliensis]|uniref:NAD(P)/FAD-dependent oxidoreductase n=1 Tax=Paenibacillus senegalimassiliensis TaxID=1737426 RepID=UPI00073F2E9C|nr:NAD(P)/FAD-dependent oxidoreductase [Paenibacillus senegalimassiliensis]